MSPTGFRNFIIIQYVLRYIFVWFISVFNTIIHAYSILQVLIFCKAQEATATFGDCKQRVVEAQNQRGHLIILTKYEEVHSTTVPENYSSTTMFLQIVTFLHEDKTAQIWLSSMKNASTPTQKSKKATRDHKKRHQKLRLHSDCEPT